MKYSRAELLARVAATRRKIEADTVEDRRDKQRRYDDALGEWWRTRATKLETALVDRLRRLRDEVPLRRDDFEVFTTYRSELVFVPPSGSADHDGNRLPDVDTSQLVYPPFLDEVERVLTSLTDDEVSAHALDQAGVLRHVRRLVGATTARDTT